MTEWTIGDHLAFCTLIVAILTLIVAVIPKEDPDKSYRNFKSEKLIATIIFIIAAAIIGLVIYMGKKIIVPPKPPVKNGTAVMVTREFDLQATDNPFSAPLCHLLSSDYVEPISTVYVEDNKWCKVRVKSSEHCTTGAIGLIAADSFKDKCPSLSR